MFCLWKQFALLLKMSIKPLSAGVLQFRAHQSHAGISQWVVACSDCNTTAVLQEHLKVLTTDITWLITISQKCCTNLSLQQPKQEQFANWKDVNSLNLPLLKQLDVNRFLLHLGILPSKQFKQSFNGRTISTCITPILIIVQYYTRLK